MPQPSAEGPDPVVLDRLVRYVWPYTLQRLGFTPEQVGDLRFLRWLHHRRTDPDSGPVPHQPA